MKIAIPSYKRSEILTSKTIPLLKSYGIKDDEIDVFVANDAEYAIYKEVLSENINLIVAIKGIKNVREFMSCYYEENEEIIYIDDDIEKIERMTMVGDKKRLENVENLRELIQEGFELCKKHQAKNWGVYPCRNAFFMKDNVSTDLKYVIGAFTGVINDRECESRLVSHGEDYERSIRYYLKYNSLVRLNYITIKTKYFAKGGIDAEYNGERGKYISSELYKLKEKYPEMMTLKQKKNYLNPLLRDKREKQIAEFLD
jgi:regulator of replication initiation timing